MGEAEQQQKPIRSPPDVDDNDERNSIDFYNQRSRIVHEDAQERMVFLFDYRSKEEWGCIHWKLLKKLKDDKKWGVLRHPMVLNFVNERLIECAFFYLVHLLSFLAFLLLLSSHIFSKDLIQDVLVTAFVIFFMFFMLLKGAIKARISQSISGWFLIAYTFNILTFVATLAYVWLPHLFEYDDFNENTKKIVLWFLPIIAVMSAWINFMYILRKSPYGIYIFMMVRILKSFGHIATIWIPTLIAFSFAFHLILRDSGVEPWSNEDPHNNQTTVERLLVILQAVTKTSTMMIGEVDADNILGTKMWIPSLLVLIFEIITVILLMNLMISLAVGDVEKLRNSSQDKILRIKLNFVIEALQLAEALDIPSLSSIHTNPTNNILVADYDGDHFTTMKDAVHKVFDESIAGPESALRFDRSALLAPPSRTSNNNGVADTSRPRFFGPASSNIVLGKPKDPSSTRSDTSGKEARTEESSDLKFHVSFSKERLRMRVGRRPVIGLGQTIHIDGFTLNLTETPESGIPEHESFDVPKDVSTCLRRAKQWFIGLDWRAYLELY